MSSRRALKNGLSLAVVLAFFVLAAGSSDGGGSYDPARSSSERTTSTADLDAVVKFDGARFTIGNNDSFDWTNVKLEVNSKAFSSGFVLRVPKLAAGQTYTVGAMQFANSDGEKFNPITHKAMNLSIWCDTPQGKGFYYGTWQ